MLNECAQNYHIVFKTITFRLSKRSTYKQSKFYWKILLKQITLVFTHAFCCLF